MNATKKTVEDAFTDAHAKSLELMASLFEVIEDQPAPGTERKLNWGHVGSLNHLNSLLDEALAFITNRE